MGLVATPGYLKDMIGFLIKAENSAERREAEKSATTVAKRIPEEENQVKVILDAMPDAKTVEAKNSLLQVLGNIGHVKGLPAIRDALGSKDSELQKAGIRALSNWPTSEPVDDLLKITQTSTDKTQKILALRGYIRLVGLASEKEADEKAQMYQTALDLSEETNEIRMVLSGLSNLGSISALNMAANCMENQSVKQEAEVAVIEIAKSAHWKDPERTIEVLNTVLESTDSQDRKDQIKKLLLQYKE
jgi:hypothetical protein